jgi:hypothetical protein
MKLVVRAFVLALVVTGAAATTLTAATSTQNKVVVTRVSVLPTPTCAPDDPNACGLGLKH